MALIATTHPDVTRILERLRFKVLETSNPDDAAQRADLVVLPFVNRPLSGVAWIRALRERSDTLPVLVITRSIQEVEEALEAGASDVLPQPLRDDVIAARFGGWLAASRSHRAAATPESPTRSPLRIYEALPDPVLVTDTDGLVLQVNRAAEHLLGYTAAEAAGALDLYSLYAGRSEADRLLQELRRSRGQVVLDRPALVRSRAGELLPVRLSAGLVHGSTGRVVGLAVLLRDDRDNAELAERLSVSTSRLVEAEQRAAESRALAESSYELNQPLTTAMGLLELVMLRPSLGQDSRDKLDRAYAQLERIAALIRKLGQGQPPNPG